MKTKNKTMTNEEYEFHIYRSLKEGQNIMARYILNNESNLNSVESIHSFLKESLEIKHALIPDQELLNLKVPNDSTQH